MLDRLLTSKYFSLSLIVALTLVVVMYMRKPCDIEGMQNVDLTPLAQELTEKPWSHHNGKNKRWNNKFDKFADAYVKNKLKKNGYSYTEFLGRSDDTYMKYIKNNEGYDQVGKEPEPASFRKEFVKCKPCNCDSD